MQNLNIFNDSVEMAYEKEATLDKRKSLGQFFTPFKIALYMAKILFADITNLNNKSVVDPSSGFGIFTRAIVSLCKNKAYFINYEIDSGMVDIQRNILNELGINYEVRGKDYLLEPCEKEIYDFVIANPPYIKHINFTNKQDLNRLFNSMLSDDFSITTNYYCYFILKSLFELKRTGRAIFIVPSEFLNSNYGVKFKKYLINEGSIKKNNIF